MSRSDNEAIRRACEAFQRSVLSLNLKTNDARAWPGTYHMEKAIDAYLEATVRGPRVDTGDVRVTTSYLSTINDLKIRVEKLETPQQATEKLLEEASHDRDLWQTAYRRLAKMARWALESYDHRIAKDLVATGKVYSMEQLRETLERGVGDA